MVAKGAIEISMRARSTSDYALGFRIIPVSIRLNGRAGATLQPRRPGSEGVAPHKAFQRVSGASGCPTSELVERATHLASAGARQAKASPD